MYPQAIKLVVTGSMGAGKTTAIGAISEIPPVVTDVLMTGEIATSRDKTTTTVAMDYGELTLDDGRKLLLFGTPGQRRYDFMCRILARGALGVLMLVDGVAAGAVEEFEYFLALFAEEARADCLVVGVTHLDRGSNLGLEPFHAVLERLGIACPVFSVDPRRREHVILMVEALLASLQFAADAVE
jgi:signal recognition particle receptor subunit beta